MENKNEIDRIYTWLKHGCYQRSLHYHNTPISCKSLYQRQLEYIKEHYKIQTPEQILSYLKTGVRSTKPSMIIGAFDGYRNQYEVLWRLLEKNGLHGWFLLVADFINTPGNEQEDALTPYRMQWVPAEYKDGRYAMTWEEAAQIARNHTIINHTSTHYLLTKESEKNKLEYEILHAQKLIWENVGSKPDIFSWLGGAWMDQSKSAGKMLLDNGYHFLIGYRLEYFEKEIMEETHWEQAVKDNSSKHKLDKEVRYYEQLISNIGWYSGIPAILPFYQKGHLITVGNNLLDIELAEHFTALAQYLTNQCGMDTITAGNRALEVLAVCRIGDGFPFI